MAATLVPTAELLPHVLPTDRLNERGMAKRELRDEVRRIDNVCNAFAVLGAWLLSLGSSVVLKAVGKRCRRRRQRPVIDDELLTKSRAMVRSGVGE